MEYKLVAIWTSRVGNESAHNVWRVISDIEFADGRVKFTIANGSVVNIDVGQLEAVKMVKVESNTL